jgi:hypothetical protein
MAHAAKQVKFLKKLHRCGKSNKPHLIAGCDQEQVFAICECVDNILRGNIPVTTLQKERLRKHYESLKNIADPNINWEEKQEYFGTQEGGALVSAALGVALPALISWLASR